MNEFGRLYELIKLRVNVGKAMRCSRVKSKVMRYSRYRIGGRMYVRLNGEPLGGSGLF